MLRPESLTVCLQVSELMSTKNEEQNEDQSEGVVIPHIQDHHCLAILAFCFFFPLGYLAYRSSCKVTLYTIPLHPLSRPASPVDSDPHPMLGLLSFPLHPLSQNPLKKKKKERHFSCMYHMPSESFSGVKFPWSWSYRQL